MVPEDGDRPALNLRPGGVVGRPAVHYSQVLTVALVSRGWSGVWGSWRWPCFCGNATPAVNAVWLARLMP